MTNRDKALLVSAARAVGTHTSQAYSADGHKGIRLFLDVTVRGSTGTVDTKIQIQDVVAKQWQDLPGAALAAIAAVGRKCLTVAPGIGETANESVSDVLTGPFRVVAVVAGETTTFSVSACLFP